MTQDRYHLSAAEIAEAPALDKAHFLDPAARRTNLSLGDLTGLTGLGVHLVTVAPGGRPAEFHLHHHEDEAVFVLAGTGTARIGARSIEIGPGDFLGYRKGGEAHDITATGDAPLQLLVVGERLAHDVCDYPEKGVRLYRDAALPAAVVDHTAITPRDVGRKT